jgi:hypothetical protein
MAKQTMVSADVLQGRRPLRLEVVHPPELVPIDERLLSVLEMIEREVSDIRNRLASFDSRLERLQDSFANRNDCAVAEREFLLYVWSLGDEKLESRIGLIPEPGDLVDEADDVIVLSVGRSPLRGDARPCVYALTL